MDIPPPIVTRILVPCILQSMCMTSSIPLYLLFTKLSSSIEIIIRIIIIIEQLLYNQRWAQIGFYLGLVISTTETWKKEGKTSKNKLINLFK